MEVEIKHVSFKDQAARERRLADLRKEAANQSPGKFLVRSILYTVVGAVSTAVAVVALDYLLLLIPIGIYTALLIFIGMQDSYRAIKYAVYGNLNFLYKTVVMVVGTIVVFANIYLIIILTSMIFSIRFLDYRLNFGW